MNRANHAFLREVQLKIVKSLKKPIFFQNDLLLGCELLLAEVEFHLAEHVHYSRKSTNEETGNKIIKAGFN
jgi:hypothetical protein